MKGLGLYTLMIESTSLGRRYVHKHSETACQLYTTRADDALLLSWDNAKAQAKALAERHGVPFSVINERGKTCRTYRRTHRSHAA